MDESDGFQTLTAVIPLKSGTAVRQWIANVDTGDGRVNGRPMEFSVPGYGRLSAVWYVKFAYFSYSPAEKVGSPVYDVARTRYPLYVAEDASGNPVALAACLAAPRNSKLQIRKDMVKLFMEPNANSYTIHPWNAFSNSASGMPSSVVPDGAILTHDESGKRVLR